MAEAFGSNHNVCFSHGGAWYDHGLDKDPYAGTLTFQASWSQYWDAARTPWRPQQTPDNFNYRSIGFLNAPLGQQLGKVIMK